MAETIFSKIIRKEIPANIVYESDNVLAFKDIDPQAPVHVLIIPKADIASVNDINSKEHSAVIAEMFDAANKIAAENSIDKEGFRLVINCGEYGGQAVNHLHMHILGGRKMNWPPG
jgi:histidine triad (HIT) family protein